MNKKQDRFPVDDEYNPNETSVVERINRQNQMIHGKPCKECDLFKKYCKCKSYKKNKHKYFK
jgi:hypothetical protein